MSWVFKDTFTHDGTVPYRGYEDACSVVPEIVPLFLRLADGSVREVSGPWRAAPDNEGTVVMTLPSAADCPDDPAVTFRLTDPEGIAWVGAPPAIPNPNSDDGSWSLWELKHYVGWLLA